MANSLNQLIIAINLSMLLKMFIALIVVLQANISTLMTALRDLKSNAKFAPIYFNKLKNLPLNSALSSYALTAIMLYLSGNIPKMLLSINAVMTIANTVFLL